MKRIRHLDSEERFPILKHEEDSAAFPAAPALAAAAAKIGVQALERPGHLHLPAPPLLPPPDHLCNRKLLISRLVLPPLNAGALCARRRRSERLGEARAQERRDVGEHLLGGRVLDARILAEPRRRTPSRPRHALRRGASPLKGNHRVCVAVAHEHRGASARSGRGDAGGEPAGDAHHRRDLLRV